MYHFLEILLPYLLAFYILSCIIYVRPFNIVFYSTLGKTFNTKTSGLSFIPLLPGSFLYSSHQIPLLFTSSGVFIPGNIRTEGGIQFHPENFIFVSYEGINSVHNDGNQLRINKQQTLYFPSAGNARQSTVLLQELKTVGDQERNRRLKEQSFTASNLTSVVEMKNAVEKQLQWISIMSTALFLAVFIGIPAFVFSELRNQIPPGFLAIPLLVLYLLTISVTLVQYKKIPGGGKTLIVLLAILSPMGAIHLTRDLCKETMSQFDYLALMAVLSPPGVFKYHVRSEYLRIDGVLTNPDFSKFQEYFENRKEVVNYVLAQKNLTRESVFKPPVKQDVSAMKYCPLCLTEYREEAEKCTECLLPLKTYT